MTKPVLPPPTGLRQRMIEDMEMRRFSRETQRNYLRDVGRFARFLGRSPDTAIAGSFLGPCRTSGSMGCMSAFEALMSGGE